MPKRVNKRIPDLEWCVVGTLAWFGLLGRPLRIGELERLLLKRRATRSEIKQAVTKLGPKISERDGYYHLAKTPVRMPNKQSEKWYGYKWWRVRLAIAAIRWVPHVRLVAVANTLADRTASQDSDIDVFIVIKHGRLYLTRTLITLMLQATGLRRHGRHIANRICLSFFATTEALDLQPIAFKPYDIYLVYWIVELLPVLETDRAAAALREANEWVMSYVPGYDRERTEPRRPSVVAGFGERLFGTFLGETLEQRLSRWQQGRIAKHPKSSDPDVRIIATDSMLKFHEKERRKIYRAQWETLMHELGYDPRLIQK